MTNRVWLTTDKFRVSKPGVDVLTADPEDPEALLISEQTQNLGILMTGVVSVNTHTYPNYPEVMYPYDLGYIPFILSQRIILEDEALNTKLFSLINNIDPDEDAWGYYLYPMKDRFRIFRTTGPTGFSIRYTVFYAKGGSL